MKTKGGTNFQSNAKPYGSHRGFVSQPLTPGSGACIPPSAAHSAQPTSTPHAAPEILAHVFPVACASTMTAITTAPTTRPNHGGAPARTGRLKLKNAVGIN